MIEKFSKNFALTLISAALVVTMSACQSKKKAEDASAMPGAEGEMQASPTIESTPMSFDAAGSDSGRIAGLETVQFDYDRASLSADSKSKLQGNANWMKANPGSLQIEGHCDSRGSIEYNLSLGERRAQAVKSYMVSLGIPGNRMSIISYGKEKPIAQGDSEAAMSRNRRANFLPLGN
jgi:peptidoglycan-associated lipoprotein